jgi:7,8-dihydroneopterin aldolase/epimerase/oxygenase
MDIFFLEGLEVPCRVGCTAEERLTFQALRVDVRMHCPHLQRAAQNDDLALSVDYRIATQLIAAVQDREFLLIERVAEVLAEVVLRDAQVEQVELTVRKRPPVQGLEIAGVQISRTRQSLVGLQL